MSFRNRLLVRGFNWLYNASRIPVEYPSGSGLCSSSSSTSFGSTGRARLFQCHPERWPPRGSSTRPQHDGANNGRQLALHDPKKSLNYRSQRRQTKHVTFTFEKIYKKNRPTGPLQSWACRAIRRMGRQLLRRGRPSSRKRSRARSCQGSGRCVRAARRATEAEELGAGAAAPAPAASQLLRGAGLREEATAADAFPARPFYGSKRQGCATVDEAALRRRASPRRRSHGPEARGRGS